MSKEDKITSIFIKLAKVRFDPKKMEIMLNDAVNRNKISKQGLNKIGIVLDNMGRKQYSKPPYDVCTKCLTGFHDDCSGKIVLCRCLDCHPNAFNEQPRCCGQDMIVKHMRDKDWYVCEKCKREVSIDPERDRLRVEAERAADSPPGGEADQAALRFSPAAVVPVSARQPLLNQDADPI
jgi:hypothetical protein